MDLPGRELSLWSAEKLSDTALALPPALLPADWQAWVDRDGLAVSFDRPQQCLSSAVARGGWVQAGGFVNMHLPGDCPFGPLGETPPERMLANHGAARGAAVDSVGMMTAATMRSLRLASTSIDGVMLSVLVTSGLANARRAGDTVEHTGLSAPPISAGTINLALGTSSALTPAAMAETLTTLTEAKAAALQDAGITSPVSGALATGTGTDATAVFCPPHGAALRYTGKHTRFGEQAARLVIAALIDAIRHDARMPCAHAR